jgi:hypothetical protein
MTMIDDLTTLEDMMIMAIIMTIVITAMIGVEIVVTAIGMIAATVNETATATIAIMAAPTTTLTVNETMAVTVMIVVAPMTKATISGITAATVVIMVAPRMDTALVIAVVTCIATNLDKASLIYLSTATTVFRAGSFEVSWAYIHSGNLVPIASTLCFKAQEARLTKSVVISSRHHHESAVM